MYNLRDVILETIGDKNSIITVLLTIVPVTREEVVDTIHALINDGTISLDAGGYLMPVNKDNG